MGLLVVFVVGGVIGWLASLLTGTEEQMGVVADVVVGCLGAVLGNLAAEPLGLGPHGPVAAYLLSVAGAVVLILVLRAVGVLRRRRLGRR